MEKQTSHKTKLKKAGLRPTRQRCALAGLLFDGGPRHVCAEQLAEEARRAGIAVSLATIYNTLNQFMEAGLLREVPVASERSYFDTNMTAHHHFFDATTGQLTDVDDSTVAFAALPNPPDGHHIEGIEVIFRIAPKQAD